MATREERIAALRAEQRVIEAQIAAAEAGAAVKGQGGDSCGCKILSETTGRVAVGLIGLAIGVPLGG